MTKLESFVAVHRTVGVGKIAGVWRRSPRACFFFQRSNKF